MRYSSVIKGYILYDLDRHMFFINRDVVFKESIFAFQFHSDALRKPLQPYIHSTINTDFGIEITNAEDTTSTSEQLYVLDSNAGDTIYAPEQMNASDSTASSHDAEDPPYVNT